MRAFGLFVVATLVILLTPSDARAVSLKNFRELAAFYSAATGVPLTDPKVQTAYQNVKSRLPKAGTVDEFSSPSVLAAIELGGAFCGSFITAEAAATPANRRAHQTIDFTKSPRVLADADILAVVHAYAQLFWLRPTTPNEDTVLQSTITTLKAASTDNVAGNKQLFLSLCTQVATSIEALVTK
jgi:hypothetical protein